MWSGFDQDVGMILEYTVQGDRDIYQHWEGAVRDEEGEIKIYAERSDSKQVGAKDQRMLTRTKNDWGKAGIAQLTYGIRSELSMQRRAEQLRQRKKREKDRARLV